MQLALEDTGGAVDTREAVERERALRSLGHLVRRARVAAYNAYGGNTAGGDTPGGGTAGGDTTGSG